MAMVPAFAIALPLAGRLPSSKMISILKSSMFTATSSTAC